MRRERLLRGFSARRAFTLVELMIVVAILAMVAIPLYRGSVEAARMSEGIAGAGSIRSAMRVYASSHDGEYPVLTAADGAGLDVIHVADVDLVGKFFGNADYSVTSTLAGYDITATDPDTGLIYEIDEAGIETTGSGYYTSGL